MKKYFLGAICIGFISLILLLPGCKGPKENGKGQGLSGHSKAYSDSELIIWMKPGTVKSDFIKTVDSIAAIKNLDPAYCSSCDSSLALLTGPDAFKALDPVAQGATGGSGGTGGGPSEGAEGYYWMVNFKMDLTDSLLESQNELKPIIDTPGIWNYRDGEVVVGVLDTGVDTANLRKTGFLFDGSNLQESCIGSRAASGWNFIVPDDNLLDEYHPVKGHGANAAWLIKEESRRFGKTQAKILPVKVIPANGPATLYHVLCGLAYAQERGAKIINASLGYYSCDKRNPNLIDSATIIFGIYIRHYLTGNNILLVAAGGNRDDDQQIEACGTITRNLDEIDFYPASFAKDTSMKNVIAVTTISEESVNPGSVSPRQNFSKNVVDIGVHADQVNGQAYSIRNTRFQNYFIEGSSYATPIVTGIIAANYKMLTRNIADIKNKYLIIDNLKSQNILKNRSDFDGLIKGGNVASHY